MRRYSPFRLSAVFLLGVTVPLVAAGSAQLGRQSFDFTALVWLAFAFVLLGPLVVDQSPLVHRDPPRRPQRGPRCCVNLHRSSPRSSALLVLSEQITGLQSPAGWRSPVESS